MIKIFERRNIIIFIILLITTLVYIFPIYWMFITSITPLQEILGYPTTFWPKHPTAEAYINNFIRNRTILPYFKNSFIIGLGTSVLTLCCAAPAAYAMARFRLKGQMGINIFLLTTQMLPAIMLAMPIFILFSYFNLVNSYIALILANATLAMPFAILNLRPYFLALPKGIEESALIDGCNRFSAFLLIILPLVMPGLLTIGIITFLWGWGDFTFALILTTSEEVRPISMGLYKFIGQFGKEWDKLLAVALVATLPIIILFIAFQKYIVSGLTSGAIKE